MTTYTHPTTDLIRIEDITRRKFISSALAAALLIACGDDDDEAEPTATPDADAGFPRDISHEMGVTTVPAKPARVVAISDFNDLDYLLALDIKPVIYGFSNAWDSGAMPWQATTGLSSFDASGAEPDFEAIVAADPDLIVAMPADDAVYQRLSQIAPTVVLGWSTPWRDGLRMIGSALGNEGLAEERIAAAEAVIAQAELDLAPIAAKRLMVGFQYNESFFIWGEETAAGLLFMDMGLNFVGGPEPVLTDASLEQVELLQDAEILLSVASDPAGIETQEASPLFKALPAVAGGGYGVLSVVQSRALGDGVSPLSLPWVVPQLVELLQALANGEGKKLS